MAQSSKEVPKMKVEGMPTTRRQVMFMSIMHIFLLCAIIALICGEAYFRHSNKHRNES